MAAPVVVKEFPMEDEYRKKTGVSPQDIKKLRSWLLTQPHLPSDMITGLCFIQRLPLCVEDKSHDGCQIFYARFIDFDAKKFHFGDTIRTYLMLLDLIQLEQGTWPGAMVVSDMEGLSLAHVAKFELQTLQQFLYYVQEAVLWRLKGIHILNAPSFIDKILMLIRPFVKREFFDMIHIYQVGDNSFEKYFSRDSLPKDVGGKKKSFEEYKKDIIERLRMNEDYFMAENKKRVTESLRPGKAKNINDFFGGIEGSFKKLDID